jgi:CRISPR-associated exonuclease Cas4
MIALHLIRQYHFCPRIVYYYLLTDIKPAYPRHVSLGEEFDALQTRLSKNRKFQKLHIDFEEVIQKKYLESNKLGICGEIDLALIGREEVVPVEYKHLKQKRIKLGHILQLYGYGRLLSETYKRVFERALVIYDKKLKFEQIVVTSQIRKSFFDTLEAIREIEQKGIMPNSSASEPQCKQCEFLNFCDDRF